MDQQALWIVAVLGSGTLIGVFWRMKGGFGPINLRVVGIVFVAVLASLLAIAKSDNLTAAMGILGAIAGYLFGARAEDSESPVNSTGVNATGAKLEGNAKIAGRDINETVNNIERMLGDLQGMASTTIKNLQLQSAGGAVPKISRRRVARFQWKSEDPSFVVELQSISRSRSDNWTQEWIDLCLEQPGCQEAIQQVVTEHTQTGWMPKEIDFDNHGDGIHINLTFERELEVAFV